MKPYDGIVILVLLALCGADRQYNAGIALRSLGDVVITGDYASLAVVCSIQELEILVDRCNYAFRFVKEKFQGKPSIFSEKVASLELQVSIMNNRLSKLTRMFKEDGLNAMELKLLYGESLEKAQLMNKKLEQELPVSYINRKLPILNQPDVSVIWSATERLLHELQENSWSSKDILLNEIALFQNSFGNIRKPAREESSNVSVVLNATVAALKYLKQNHSKDMLKTGELLRSLYDAFEVDISLSVRLSFFDSILQYLNEKMWLLLEGLDSMLASGRLNSQLAPPKNLTEAIRDAYRDLPRSFKPLFDLNYNYDGDVHHYYPFAEITAVVLFNNSIRIFVDLPLRAENRFFHLYEARSLPVYSSVYGDFLQIMPPSDLLLVNKMKDKAAWMKTFTLLNECKNFEGRFVCPVITHLETVDNSCILNMLLMKVKAVSKLCKVQTTSENIPSTWIRDKNGWIYSVTRSTRLERVKEDARTPETFSVSGTGFLMDQRHTYTKTDDGFILYPALNNMNDEVIVPNIDLTSLDELQIEKTTQEMPGNGTGITAFGTSLRDSQRRKESLLEKDDSVGCDTTPLWVAIIINFLLLASLSVWVYTLRRPVSHSKAIIYKSSSEEDVKMNGVDAVDN